MTSPYFIYVGNAYPHKNLKRLVEAIVFLNKNRPQKLTLVIVSPRNVFLKRLEKLIKEADAQGFVKLLGQIPDAQLGRLYKEAVAFIFPSLSEGFGLPGLEAMAAGTLVLASDIPVFKEVYQDSAIYFNPLKVEAIAAAMKQALKIDKIKRQKIISASQNFIKRYSWRRMAEETLNMYRGVNRNTPPRCTFV